MKHRGYTVTQRKTDHTIRISKNGQTKTLVQCSHKLTKQGAISIIDEYLSWNSVLRNSFFK